MVDLVRRGHCDLVINTPLGGPGARSDGYLIREAALAARVPVHHDDGRREGSSARDRRRPGRPRRLAAGANQCAEEKRLRVVANEAVGPYSLIRVERGGLEPGIPGQFFMLEAPGRLAAAPDEPLPGAAGRAELPARGDRAWNPRAGRGRTRRRAPRLRPARQRLPARRREAASSSAAASGSRRSRTSRNSSAARLRSSASAATGTPRPPRSSRTPRSSSSRRSSPSS